MFFNLMAIAKVRVRMGFYSIHCEEDAFSTATRTRSRLYRAENRRRFTLQLLEGVPKDAACIVQF